MEYSKLMLADVRKEVNFGQKFKYALPPTEANLVKDKILVFPLYTVKNGMTCSCRRKFRFREGQIRICGVNQSNASAEIHII